MQTTLHSRLERDREEGFTLIELMVVVLIIGILLAIAIPTFLGARDRASNRASQANLRNAITSEKTLFTDNQQYESSTGTGLTDLQGVEPNLNWVAAAPVGTKDIQAAAANGNGTLDYVIVGAKSQTGKCFYMAEESLPGPTLAPGTYYFQQNTCGAAPAQWGATAPTTGFASKTPGQWALNW